jgi:hypothetical protein
MNIPVDKLDTINKLIISGPGILIKWFFVIGLVMYAFFALVITRQVKLMTNTIESEVNIAVTMFAWVHFLLTVLLVIAAIVLL